MGELGIKEKSVYLIDNELSYMCIAINDNYIVMAAFYGEDEDGTPTLHMDDVLVYDRENPDYGPIEKIADYGEKGTVQFEYQ